jgi:hypothetical protein
MGTGRRISCPFLGREEDEASSRMGNVDGPDDLNGKREIRAWASWACSCSALVGQRIRGTEAPVEQLQQFHSIKKTEKTFFNSFSSEI